MKRQLWCFRIMWWSTTWHRLISMFMQESQKAINWNVYIQSTYFPSPISQRNAAAVREDFLHDRKTPNALTTQKLNAVLNKGRLDNPAQKMLEISMFSYAAAAWDGQLFLELALLNALYPNPCSSCIIVKKSLSCDLRSWKAEKNVIIHETCKNNQGKAEDEKPFWNI
jgi:hypothetical protein